MNEVDKITAKLAGMEARIDAATGPGTPPISDEAIDALADVGCFLNALRAVVAGHTPHECADWRRCRFIHTGCAKVGTCELCGTPWPCPPIQNATEALEGIK